MAWTSLQIHWFRLAPDLQSGSTQVVVYGTGLCWCCVWSGYWMFVAFEAAQCLESSLSANTEFCTLLVGSWAYDVCGWVPAVGPEDHLDLGACWKDVGIDVRSCVAMLAVLPYFQIPKVHNPQWLYALRQCYNVNRLQACRHAWILLLFFLSSCSLLRGLDLSLQPHQIKVSEKFWLVALQTKVLHPILHIHINVLEQLAAMEVCLISRMFFLLQAGC